MRIGDKVRFLNEIGGGIVAGFQGNNIILIEDEDGFQIPMNIREVVVVDNDSDKKQSQRISTQPTASHRPSTDADNDNRSIKSLIGGGYNQSAEEETVEEEYDPSDKEITFVKPIEERLGGNSLHIYLCFVPANIKELSQTKFDAYIVNDSNYYIYYTYSTRDEQVWNLRSNSEIAPNTKQFIEEVRPENINSIENISLQIIAFKKQKDYVLKPVIDAQLRIEPLKFHKLHSYDDNHFFESKAMIHPIVEDDQLVITPSLELNPEKIRQEMLNKKQADNLTTKLKNDYPAAHGTSRSSLSKSDRDPLVVDLHAHEILETTQGMTSIDILQYQLDVFRKTLKNNARNKGTRIVFIHGKGEGVLRRAILNELNYHYKSYQYQDASFQEYGYGATQVTIK